MSGETLKALADAKILADGIEHEFKHVQGAVRDLDKRVADLKAKTVKVVAKLSPDTTVPPASEFDYADLDGALATLRKLFLEGDE